MLQILGSFVVSYATYWVVTSTHPTATKIREKVKSLFGKE
jgi:hypothetical protein